MLRPFGSPFAGVGKVVQRQEPAVLGHDLVHIRGRDVPSPTRLNISAKTGIGISRTERVPVSRAILVACTSARLSKRGRAMHTQLIGF